MPLQGRRIVLAGDKAGATMLYCYRGAAVGRENVMNHVRNLLKILGGAAVGPMLVVVRLWPRERDHDRDELPDLALE